MQTVAIIDYGSGNLRSAAKAFERMAAETGLARTITVTADAAVVAAADRVVLPGVGAFADCRRGVTEPAGLMAALQTAVIEKARPFLGICVGMQLMATRGLEHGETPGFDWIAGDVVAIQPSSPELKIPHMGWNRVRQLGEHPVWAGIPQDSRFYFVHSYYVVPEQPELSAGLTDYGVEFASALAKDNLFAVQFHPEKSAHWGLELLRNFVNWNI